MEEINEMNRYENGLFHNVVVCRLQEAEREAEQNKLRYSAHDVLKSVASELEIEETMQDLPMYDPVTGLPADPAYLECRPPEFLSPAETP